MSCNMSLPTIIDFCSSETTVVSKDWGYEKNIRHLFPINELIESLKTKTMIPFKIDITIPIRKSDIFENNLGCSRQEIGIVSIERAIEIRNAIDRQLKGLKLTEPAKPSPKKKISKKK